MLTTILLVALLAYATHTQTAPSFGRATNFAVLGATTVTNTGGTIVTGDLGVSPGSAITGFPPGVVNGVIHAGTTSAAEAQTDATVVYTNLTSLDCTNDLTGQDLGGMTLLPGIYCFDSEAALTGTLTLNAQGDPNAVFIFQIGTTLTTASNATINLINGTSACNVFFLVGTSATFGTGTSFQGNVIAQQSITFTTDASLVGRAIALNGAVTLDTNDITLCTPATSAPTGMPTGMPTGVPTGFPTGAPTGVPTGFPTSMPTGFPTGVPTGMPTGMPTAFPTGMPTGFPTGAPTGMPTPFPTAMPTALQTGMPTGMPTAFPTGMPTGFPTGAPTGMPTGLPTPFPTSMPTPLQTGMPTGMPTPFPTGAPTPYPTGMPTPYPTGMPTGMPTQAPTKEADSCDECPNVCPETVSCCFLQ